MSEENSGIKMLPPEDDRRGCLRRGVIALVVTTVVLLVTGAIVIRSEGARDLITTRLSELTDLEMRIDGARIAFPYDPVILGIESGPTDAGLGGIRMGRLRVGLTPGGRRRIHADRCELTIVQAENESWRPACFSALGRLTSVEQLGAVTESFRGRTMLRVSDSRIEWLDFDGNRIAQAEGIAFQMQPVTLPGRRATHCRLSVYRYVAPNGDTVNEMEREWLFTENNDVVEIESRSAVKEGTADKHSLWTPRGDD